ncbi:Rhamnulokinase [Planctomycetes bacterium Pan216]|uniref:Rhamnulokinase n=1 Tax=Kolteria novifilia TaxID=2527975 RepID=A0A518BC51_9BACT|nr:Rhamnulokinase [Planctomycetes bacterium Pan216]
MATKDFLAVDLGAESGRTIVGHFDGEELQIEESHRFANLQIDVLGTVYWDTLRLWHEIKTGIAKAVRQFGPPSAIGIDTWGIDFGLLNAEGSLVGNPVCYRDARTDGMMEAAFEIMPRDEVFQRTGIQFLKFNTLYQLLAMKHHAASADPFSGVASLLFMPDLLSFFLTGRKGAEYSIASTSQLLDAVSKTWDLKLIEQFGLPEGIFPEIVPTGSVVGDVTSHLVDEIGVVGTKVIASPGHDTAAAVVAVPAGQRNDWCYISSGTWSLMGAEVPSPVINAKALACKFTNEGGIGNTIRFLKNIMGLWLVQQSRKSFVEAGNELDYATLTRLAEEAPAFGSIVDPNNESLFNPTNMVEAIQDCCRRSDQPVPSDEGAIVRCCLESLALCYRQTVEELEEVLGKRFSTIHIVGGGCRNELLCRMTADCTGRVVVAGPVEATSIGNCLVQAMAVGELGSLADIRAVVRRNADVKTYEPQPNPQWDEHYARYRALIS